MTEKKQCGWMIVRDKGFGGVRCKREGTNENPCPGGKGHDSRKLCQAHYEDWLEAKKAS